MVVTVSRKLSNLILLRSMLFVTEGKTTLTVLFRFANTNRINNFYIRQSSDAL